MEEIYMNIEYDKSVHSRPSTSQTGPKSTERRFHGSVDLCLGLLSVFLLAGLIGLGVHYHNSARGAATELFNVKANLTELLQDRNNKLSSLTEDRKRLNASLIQMTEERDRLQKMIRQKKTCPARWTMFSCSCYFLSSKSGSWTKGRDDCRKSGGDLVAIDSAEEQNFLSEFAKVESWIGLNDKDKEGTWKWIDGTPLSVKYWSPRQPDNGNGNPYFGEEDCVHFRQEGSAHWNDRSCEASLPWICEKSLLRYDI